jgi:IrrE N-terminal-like domain
MSLLATPTVDNGRGEQETVPGPVTDPRADVLRRRYHELFGGEELPVPVESIAEDLLGLSINEDEELPVSGMLLPAERQIWVNAREAQESPGRRRFTVAHEVGHWVCQCLEGRGEQVMCRAEDISPEADRTLEREANVFAAELLMPEPAVRAFSSEPDPAPCFGVSGLAMRWRLYSFGLLEDKPQ